MAATTDKWTPGAERVSDTTTVDKVGRLLEEWRGRIDDILVRADLASKDVREAVRAQATIAENAYLAAANRLREVPRDAGVDRGSVRDAFDKVLDDLRQAVESAESVIRRGSVE